MNLGFIDSIQKILREAYHAYHEINTETPLLLHQKRVMEKCLVIYFFKCACCCNPQHSFSAYFEWEFTLLYCCQCLSKS